MKLPANDMMSGGDMSQKRTCIRNAVPRQRHDVRRGYVSELWEENGPLLGPTDLDIYNSTDVRGINHSRKGIVIHGKNF